MPGPTNPYIYQPNDDPISLANQYGITPNQLLQANPGGYPFSQGQRINLPFQYSAPIGPQPFVGPQAANTVPVAGRGTILPQNPMAAVNSANLAMRGRGYRPPGSYASSEQGTPARGYGTDDSWYRPTAPTTPAGPSGPTGNKSNGYGGFENKGGPGNTDFANTAAAQYNAANNVPFLSQKRWDPNRRKYISVGQWLKQGRRKGRGGRGDRRPQQRAQNFSLANSIIDFGVSSG